MRDFTVWVSYGKWRKNGDIRYCLLHLIHLSSTRLRRCGRILSGICEPYCLITPDLTMRYCPIFILIDYKQRACPNHADSNQFAEFGEQCACKSQQAQFFRSQSAD